MLKIPAKKLLLSLVLSSLLFPAFSTSIAEEAAPSNAETLINSINQAEALDIPALLKMDRYERHELLTDNAERLKKNAEANKADDLFLLGYYYYSEGEDNATVADFKKAKELFLKAEKAGSIDATYLLGELYFYGEGVSQNYETATKYYEEAGAKGQKDAIFSLGSIYMTGYGTEANPVKAIEYLKKAAMLNDSSSISTLGYLYESGEIEGIEQDLTEAASWFKLGCENGEERHCNSFNKISLQLKSFTEVFNEIKAEQGEIRTTNLKPLPNTMEMAALDDTYQRLSHLKPLMNELITGTEQGNPDATYLLGLYYETVGDSDYDDAPYIQAKVLYEKAQELGSIDALYSLGELYYYGNGVEQDYEKSLAYYSNPLLAEYPEAVFSLGVQYDSGEGVEQSFEKSFELFKKASALGHAPSTFNVGYMYHHGEFVDVDLEEAKKWYLESCTDAYTDGCSVAQSITERLERGDTETNPALNSLFDEIMDTIEPEAALELTTESILQANQRSARQFLNSQTETLLEKIKNNEDAESLFLMGYFFYLEGLENDHSQSLVQSKVLMEKAAAQGNEEAIFYLGKYYFEGIGTEADIVESRVHLERLRESDHPEALFYLGAIYDEGMGVEVDQETSFNLYKKAAELGHAASAYNVGFMYQYGEFVDADNEKALEWYKNSCNLGDSDGCNQADTMKTLLSLEDAADAWVDETTEDLAVEVEIESDRVEGEIRNIFDDILNIVVPK